MTAQYKFVPIALLDQEPKRSKLGCLTLTFFGLVFLASFFSFVGRPDTWEEVRMGQFEDWIITGPLWAGFVAALCASFSKRRGLVVTAALGTWVAASSLFSWFEYKKLQMRSGPGTLCMSNLKQVALAIDMYSDLYQGRCPMDSTNPTLVGSMQLLSNVSPSLSAKILYCPSDHRPGARAEADFKKLTLLNISYSYVPNLSWRNTPDSIVALDRIYTTSTGSTWPTDGNHKGKGGFILFNDGHDQWYEKLPSSLKDKDGKKTVLSP